LVLEETDGLNKKYMEFYNKIYRYYDVGMFFIDLWMKLYGIINRSFPDPIEITKNFGIKEGDMVLETSIGTGRNMKYLPKNIQYYGIDINKAMLKKCMENMIKKKRKIELYLGNAEFLPFKDETFDCVFHIGGINFFNDRRRAIEEMIRVAKPGAKITIGDEMEKTIKDHYEKMPEARKSYKLSEIEKSRVVAPIDLVPFEMKDITVKNFKDFFYILAFRKP